MTILADDHRTIWACDCGDAVITTKDDDARAFLREHNHHGRAA